jgi:hypothetical protein
MSNEQNDGGGRRLSAAAVNIAKGAATGGVHGAAVGVVQSFLPEIAKLALILLLLPILAFTAIPNIIFGYGSATDAEVIDFNDRASSLDAAYGLADVYTRTEIDVIVEYIKALNTTADGEPLFDAVEVTEDTDHTNIYWLIAITSVANKQDLFTMDGGTVQGMIKKKLVSVWAILESLLDDGVSIFRTLKIDVSDLDPDALMDKLHFTAEERSWAALLHSTIAEEQSLDLAYSDGAGYYGTDYGNIIFTDAATEVVYYNQTDARWGNMLYGKTNIIGKAGCGPTALAIAVASLTDNRVTPDAVAAWSVENGYRVEGDGSSRALITDGGAHYGLTVTGIGNDASKVVEALQSGKLVIAIMAQGHFTSGGHFIVLRGVTADGNILVADPGNVTRSGQEWALSLIVNEASRKTAYGGPFWVMAG